MHIATTAAAAAAPAAVVVAAAAAAAAAAADNYYSDFDSDSAVITTDQPTNQALTTFFNTPLLCQINGLVNLGLTSQALIEECPESEMKNVSGLVVVVCGC
jgi:hypothetical protein